VVRFFVFGFAFDLEARPPLSNPPKRPNLSPLPPPPVPMEGVVAGV